MIWAIVGAVFVMAASNVFPHWHWTAQLALALGSGAIVVGVYYWVLP